MSRWKAPLVAAAVVFVVGQAGTVMLARNAGDQVTQRLTAEFDDHVDDTAQSIEDRILTATFAVRALEGLFATDDQVDRGEFHHFVQSVHEMASVRTLGYVAAVPTSQRETFVSAVRSDTTLRPEGYPAFEVHPETTHPEMFIPVYIEPLVEGNPAFGFDLGTNPTRRVAIEKARDTGMLVASRGIDLVSDGSKGFLLILPIYRGGQPATLQQRRSQFAGVVQAVISIESLLAGVPGIGRFVEVEIYDSARIEGSPDGASLLYRTGDRLLEAEEPTTQRRLEVGDRVWTVVAAPVPIPPGFNAFGSIPTVITFTGTLLTLAMAITAFTLVDGRERAFHRARRLTGELQEQTEHLRVTRDRAIEADRLKTAFLANMSHELRTPLTSVIGLSSVLLKGTFGGLEDKQREYLDMISASGSHLLDIVEDMLDLARIEAGREDLALEDFDLALVIEEAAGMIHADADAKGVRLSPPTSAEPLPIAADRRRIRQVLLNLLSNAVKFTDRGGQAGISVTTRPGEVSVTVWDTGIGIPSDHLPRIFAPFHQVDSTLTKSRAGSGLGLALAKRLAEMHQGSLTVSSREGEGTEFTLTLPLLSHPGRSDRPEPVAQPAPELDGARVLVAEDSGVNRMLMTDLLKLAGCEVLEAADGEEALALARTETPDLIVLDIMLPVMDGITVAKLLKEDRKMRAIPIIAVTALAMPEERQRIVSAGCDAYLAKPFTHDQYLGAVAELLTSRTSSVSIT